MKQTGISNRHQLTDAGLNKFSCMPSVASLDFISRERSCINAAVSLGTIVSKVFSSVEIGMFSTLNYKLKERDLCLQIFMGSIW